MLFSPRVEVGSLVSIGNDSGVTTCMYGACVANPIYDGDPLSFHKILKEKEIFLSKILTTATMFFYLLAFIRL